jgi:hypothetical protein
MNGRTEQGAKLTINEESVQVSSDGSFSYNLGLMPGRNKVTIIVTDTAGNTLSKTVFIEYNQSVDVGWSTLILIIGLVIVAVVAGTALYVKKKKSFVERNRQPKVKRPIKKKKLPV